MSRREYSLFGPARLLRLLHINRVLVSRALGLLKVNSGERVIDWFCGLGNFTLPLATQAREVPYASLTMAL